ncbi:MAG: hypothetical protein NTV51_29645 [Verrucomicrobia bacterium]|nr:hypothetical protein [Verrucomicrobiota bacterium]
MKETVEAGRKGQFLEKNTVRLAERFQWPLALGVWCLLVSFYAEFPVRPRPREIKLTTSAKSPMPAAKSPAAATTVAALLLLCLLLPPSAFGISPAATPSSAVPPTSGPTVIRPPASGPAPLGRSPVPGEAAPDAGPALGKIYARLATQDTLHAQDYAEIAHETVRWGNRLLETGQQVIPGPVRDAIEAVDRLIKIDSRIADWTKVRKELEDLLKKSEEQKEQQQKQDEKDKQDQKDQQDKDQQDKEQKNQDQKKSDQQKQSKDQKDSQEKSDEQKKQDQQQQDKDAKEKQGESAFGDMKKNEPPPPPPQPDPGTQKVGGTPEKKPEDQQPSDPALALPLQKLEQLRNQDSPARLFQMMEGEKKPAVKTKGKDW